MPDRKACRQTFVWYLGEPEGLGEQLRAEADARRWHRAADTSVTTDGTEEMWHLASQHVPESAHIVDWYHANTHVWQAAHTLHGTEEAASA